MIFFGPNKSKGDNDYLPERSTNTRESPNLKFPYAASDGLMFTASQRLFSASVNFLIRNSPRLDATDFLHSRK